ncbi:hypothetical protein EB001_04885, partial [bacterium]|nr:hypothetical protein [bacterium]
MSNELKTPLNSFSPIVTTPVPPFPDHTPSLIGHSINPASGYYGISWPASGSLPHSFSTGGWTIGDRGFQQQTFLGASIRSFNLNGGFGDTSSTLNVELVNDEFNTSDQTNLGYGDDVYHSGKFDLFSPPPVGSPVFFKFGQNFATVEEVYKPTFDKLYKMLTVPDLPPLISNGTGGFNFLSFYSAGSTVSNNSRADIEGGGFIDITPYISGPARGKFHLKFGGILQSYTQNRGPGGDPVYSVQVVDPREILSNTVLILNNYTGSTFNNKNLFNIYGFLEHNLTENAKNAISGALPYVSILEKILVNNSGTFYFKGNDTYNNPALQGSKDIEQTLLSLGASSSATSLPPSFPITGTGFSRRGSQGIPYYRVKQAVQCLMGSNGILPQEYVEKGFGGAINFRGFNYVVDFGSLPDLPDFYYFDFDQINLLDLILEMCDVLSGDLFVTLLPVINHPACNFLYKYNLSKTSTPQDMIHGIIRLDFIDRSKQPEYGAIKTYIDSLANNNIYVENQDVGYELSNVVTDKFIVGAQEVNLYYFTTQGDRDNLDVIRQKFGLGARMSPGEKWSLKTSLKQQLLPYYGMLGNHAVTIPKGFGAYQQILLDATSLNANGVGAYYVATEMELRCAAESYKRWVEFLAMYNDTYMESIEPNDGEESLALTASPAPPNGNPPKPPISNNYAVTVPRSVFPTYATKGKEFGDDGLPSSPCNPPYGYPLYYKRMTKIGVPEGGLTDLTNRWTTTITVLASLKNNTDSTNFNTTLSSEITRLKQLIDGGQQLTAFEQTYYQQLQDLLNNARSNSNPARIQDSISIVEKSLEANKHIFTVLPKVAKKNSENALKIYNFLKKIADECLGKKFLVKIPKEVNPFYSPSITLKDQNTKEYGSGPFGFKPLPVNSGIGYETSSTFAQSIQQAIRESDRSKPISEIFLSSDTLTNSKNLAGGLNVNYNPIIDQYEFNYTPVDQGGYFDFNLYGNILQPNQAALIQQYDFNKLPYSVKDLLTPQDMTNFINEDGKVSPYVRFDNSQDLSLEALGADDFVQQVITAAGPITDLSEALDNIKEDKFHSFQKPNTNPPAVTKTVAFVKCSVDSKLYMPPKSSEQSLNVYAQNPIPKLKYTIPKKIYL